MFNLNLFCSGVCEGAVVDVRTRLSGSPLSLPQQLQGPVQVRGVVDVRPPTFSAITTAGSGSGKRSCYDVGTRHTSRPLSLP